jgi:hypothetical protein
MKIAGPEMESAPNLTEVGPWYIPRMTIYRTDFDILLSGLEQGLKLAAQVKISSVILDSTCK